MENVEDEILKLKNALEESEKNVEEWEKMALEAEENSIIANKKIEKMNFDLLFDDALRSSGAKNITAVKALLNPEKIKVENEKLIGFDEEIEKLKEENEYLFSFENSSKGTGEMEEAGINWSKEEEATEKSDGNYPHFVMPLRTDVEFLSNEKSENAMRLAAGLKIK